MISKMLTFRETCDKNGIQHGRSSQNCWYFVRRMTFLKSWNRKCWDFVRRVTKMECGTDGVLQKYCNYYCFFCTSQLFYCFLIDFSRQYCRFQGFYWKAVKMVERFNKINKKTIKLLKGSTKVKKVKSFVDLRQASLRPSNYTCFWTSQLFYWFLIHF